MSYLQITTKCNFSCDHCCYSCTMRGKHGDYSQIIDNIAFIRGMDSELITIGGGEPTLHPRFFDILKICIRDFDYIWMATNGSQTESMQRLSNIINMEDYPECTCEEDDPDEYAEYGCLCHEKMDYDGIYQENKLTVALSQDPWHDAIDHRIARLWKSRAGSKHNGYEIRDVSQAYSGVTAQGRAKKTGAGWGERCVCSTLIIKPDGKIRLCGCTRSPVIGTVYSGIESKWQRIIDHNRGYEEYKCFRHIR